MNLCLAPAYAAYYNLSLLNITHTHTVKESSFSIHVLGIRDVLVCVSVQFPSLGWVGQDGGDSAWWWKQVGIFFSSSVPGVDISSYLALPPHPAPPPLLVLWPVVDPQMYIQRRTNCYTVNARAHKAIHTQFSAHSFVGLGVVCSVVSLRVLSSSCAVVLHNSYFFYHYVTDKFILLGVSIIIFFCELGPRVNWSPSLFGSFSPAMKPPRG